MSTESVQSPLMFNSYFSNDDSIKTYISERISDPWIGTLFAGYVHIHPGQKGEFGELFISKILQKAGFDVIKRTDVGHDRLVNGIATEFKFSLASRNRKKVVVADNFMINHVSLNKNWERLIFCGINPDENDLRLFWFSKEDFYNHLNSKECLFKCGNGGVLGSDDDYMSTKVKQILCSKLIKSMSEWK